MNTATNKNENICGLNDSLGLKTSTVNKNEKDQT
jgi:hypothetical protein